MNIRLLVLIMVSSSIVMAVENDIKISGGYLNCVVNEIVIKGDMIEIKYHDTEPPKYLNGPVDVYVFPKNSKR